MRSIAEKEEVKTMFERYETAYRYMYEDQLVAAEDGYGGY